MLTSNYLLFLSSHPRHKTLHFSFTLRFQRTLLMYNLISRPFKRGGYLFPRLATYKRPSNVIIFWLTFYLTSTHACDYRFPIQSIEDLGIELNIPFNRHPIGGRAWTKLSTVICSQGDPARPVHLQIVPVGSVRNKGVRQLSMTETSLQRTLSALNCPEVWRTPGVKIRYHLGHKLKNPALCPVSKATFTMEGMG